MAAKVAALVFSAVYHPFGVPYRGEHEVWFKGDKVIKAVDTIVKTAGTELHGDEAKEAAAQCLVGNTLVQFVTGIAASDEHPNAAMLNDMPLQSFDFCNFQPDLIRHRVLHPGVVLALLLSTDAAEPATDASDDAPAPYTEKYYRIKEDHVAEAHEVEDKAGAGCAGDDTGYCAEHVASHANLAKVSYEAAEKLVPEEDLVKAKEEVGKGKGGNGKGKEVIAEERFARQAVRGSGQQVLSAADSGLAHVTTAVDGTLTRPAWHANDPNFDHWQVHFLCFGCAIWRVDMRPFANCYAYATETSYYDGRVNRINCRPGRAGAAALAGNWENNGGGGNTWGLVYGGARGWLDLNAMLTAWGGAAFPNAGTLVIAAHAPVCNPLMAAVGADGLIAAGAIPHGAGANYNAVRVYAHLTVVIRPFRTGGIFGPPVNSFYHGVCNDNTLRRFAQGAALPGACYAVEVNHHVTDYHFQRRNDNDGHGNQQWSDKNGDQPVHGVRATADANDDHWQRRAYANLYAAVHAEIGRNNDRAVGIVTVASSYCGELFALAHQVASAARGGPVHGRATDCAA